MTEGAPEAAAEGAAGRPAVISPDGLVQMLLARDPARRTIVALAGAPGSGKSTTAERVVRALNATAPGRAALLPMDGYHYDDGVLNEMGRRPWKGAPDTFDVGGLRATLSRLRTADEETVAVPVFDRAIEIARAGARLIPRSADLILCEGNYLLLSRAPWDSLAPFFDMRILIDVGEGTLRARLARRWEGFGLSPEEIRRKLEENDLPNGRTVIAESRGADFLLRT
jgi:pantothenate kinase